MNRPVSPTRTAALLSAALLAVAAPAAVAQEEASTTPAEVEAAAPTETAPEGEETPGPQPQLEAAPEPQPATSAPEVAVTQPSERSEPAEPTVPPRAPIGLALSVEVSSAYVFRGLNVFQESTQLDQHFLFAPALAYTVPGTGLTLSYWGAFQLSGDNAAGLIDAGLGHEQDLIASYAWTLVPDTVTLTAGLAWYFYPFADEATTGAGFTSYLEPGVTLAYTGPVTLSLQVSYFIGVADALWPYSYVYFRPRLSRAVELGSVFSFNFGLSFGYKQYTDPGDLEVQNRFDVQLDWELPIRATDRLTITPAMHLAWTDLADRPLDTEFAVWGGLLVSIGI
jgi:hypothetical protein